MADERSGTQVSQALGQELLQIHRESYGAGAESAKVLLSDDAVVVFLDGLELLPNEQFMVDQGQIDIVLSIRRRYQESIAASFIAAVERATGRSVANFFSETTLDPPFCVEVFRLAPRRGSDDRA